MKIPPEVVARYGTVIDGVLDADAAAFVAAFDCVAGGRVLVAGCHDECTPNMMSEAGWEVVGFDLREYDEKLPRCNYRFVCGDFCQMPHTFKDRYRGKFDAFVSLSAIEHFGLGGYGEAFFHPFYDAVAMNAAREMLRPGGRAYVTVPFGARHVDVVPNWRVYDMGSAMNRLGRGYATMEAAYFTSGPCVVQGEQRAIGELLTPEQAGSYGGDPPHVTTLLIITKGER